MCYKVYTTYYCSMNRRLLLLLIIARMSGSIFAQNTQSPYSSRGFGEPEAFMTAYNKSLGGVVNGIRSKRTISLANPASVSGLTQVTLEFGFRGDYSTIFNSSGTRTAYNGNFNYFTLGFPVWRKPVIKQDTSRRTEDSEKKILREYKTIWSVAFGMTPYSSIFSSYYKTVDTSYGPIMNFYEKSGGLSRLFLMNGVNITKSLSVGLTTSYLFGQSRYRQAFYVNDSGVSRATFDDNNLRMSGFRFDFGVQGHVGRDSVFMSRGWNGTYDSIGRKAIVKRVRDKDSSIINGMKVLGYHNDTTWQRIQKKHMVGKHRGLEFIYGATVSNQSNLRYTVYRSILSRSNYYVSAPIDTILDESNVKGRTFIPMSYSAGFSLTLDHKWMIAADYKSDMWSKMDRKLFDDSFSNSSQISLGFAYRPQVDPDRMDLRRIGKKKRLMPNLEYRLGFRMLNTGYHFKDNLGNIRPMKEYGISFGIGIPKMRYDWDRTPIKTMINLTGEYIHRGTTTNGLIEENLFRITIGFTFPDVWFRKKQFY